MVTAPSHAVWLGFKRRSLEKRVGLLDKLVSIAGENNPGLYMWGLDLGEDPVSCYPGTQQTFKEVHL